MSVLDVLSVDAEFYDMTTKNIKNDAEKGKLLAQQAGAIETEARKASKGADYEVMSREKALSAIEKVELIKAQATAGIIIASQMGKVPREHVPQAQEMAKIKALDELEKTEGVDNDDIVIAFNEYSLQESEEFKAIMAKANQTMQQTIQMIQQNIQAQMASQGGRFPPGMGPGGPGGAPPGMMRRPAPPQGPPANAPKKDMDAADLGW